ncbi:MAG: hypothetical protein ACR2MK_03315 [Solirubrobacteraceae bacterium]
MSRLFSLTGGARERRGNDVPARDAAPPHAEEHRPLITELEHLLREGGCPTCRYVEAAQRSFFSWFEIESFSTVEVQARLRARIRMCPAHSRRLVEEIGEGHIMTTVLREALSGARQAVRGEVLPGSCPACDAVAFASERARHVLVGELLDPANARLYCEHHGRCLPHLLQAAPMVEPATLKMLAERLLTSLQEGDASARADLLAGVDRDARRRATWRGRLPEQPTIGSTVAQLCSQLEIEACPACLSTGLAERHYVGWFLERTGEDDPSLRSDPGELCAAHLHDVALANRSLAARAIERKRAVRMGDLQRLLDRLAALPAPVRRGRRAGTDDLGAARIGFMAAPYCSACHARNGIERSQLELIAASLALAPVRERYQRGHGLCVRHGMQVTDTQAARLAKHHVDARLGVLAWEVHDTARKYAWAYRHERSGPEQDAWLRALAQVDGRVFEGGPAPGGPEAAVLEQA